jgi:hypothetical protein
VREAAEPFVSKLFPRGTKLLRQAPHQGDRPLPGETSCLTLVWAVLDLSSPMPPTASGSPGRAPTPQATQIRRTRTSRPRGGERRPATINRSPREPESRANLQHLRDATIVGAGARCSPIPAVGAPCLVVSLLSAKGEAQRGAWVARGTARARKWTVEAAEPTGGCALRRGWCGISVSERGRPGPGLHARLAIGTRGLSEKLPRLSPSPARPRTRSMLARSC